MLLLEMFLNLFKKIYKKLNITTIIFIILILSLGAIFCFGSKLSLNNKPSIILITIDALRPDHMSAYGYSRQTTPFIAQLAKDSIKFSEAISVSSATITSIPSILTSTYPGTNLVQSFGDIIPDRIKTLAEILKENGYYTGIIASFSFSPFFNKGKEYDSTFIKRFDNTPLFTKEAIRWLKGNQKKFFLYIHYHDPHGPYTPPEPFSKKYLNDQEYNENSRNIPILDSWEEGLGGIPRSRLLADNKDLSYYISQYDAEINYADFYIGQLMKFLKESGIYSKVILIITADHGESMGEHNYYFNHGEYLYDVLIRVPLIIKLPKERPKDKIISTQVSLIDLTPTLLDILKISNDKYMQGHSFKKLIFGDDRNFPKYVFCEIAKGSRAAIRTKEWKLIFSKKGNNYELYNLKSDPDELINVAESEKSTFVKLKGILDKWMQRNISNDIPPHRPLQEEDKLHLKSLGYLE